MSGCKYLCWTFCLKFFFILNWSKKDEVLKFSQKVSSWIFGKALNKALEKNHWSKHFGKHYRKYSNAILFCECVPLDLKFHYRKCEAVRFKDFISTAWKVSVFRVLLILILPHSDWILNCIFGPNADTFHAV